MNLKNPQMRLTASVVPLADQSKPPRRRRQAGFSLATMISLLFIMALIGGAAMSLVSTSLKLAQKQVDATEALNIADAGVDLAYAWLTSQDPPPLSAGLKSMGNFYGTSGTIPAPFGRVGSSLTVRIRADATNPSSTQKRYLVESTGLMPSGAKVVVRTYMQQVSFGKYAFFADNDGDGYWAYNNYFEGPFHANDSDGKPTTIFWKTGQQANPMFQYAGDDAFSVSGDVLWWKNAIGTVAAPTLASDFTSLAASGQSSVTTGYKTDASGNLLYDTSGQKIPNSPRIPLPTTTYSQQYVALGLTPPVPATSGVSGGSLPTANGVKFTPGGGLYIKSPNKSSANAGDNDVTLQVDALGNQQIVVAQKISGNTTTQTVTINKTLGITTIVTQAPPLYLPVSSVTTGLPNGMVYSDGTITSLKGTVANNTVVGSGAAATVLSRSAMTITTDISAGRDIYIADDIKYQVNRDFAKKQDNDSNFNLNAGTLGILTRKAIIRKGAASTHSYNLQIDGSVFATDSFYPEDYKGPIGKMVQTGGVIVKNSGIFANGNSSGITSGYNEEYHYDNRLADNPPPFFPTTGTQYDIKSWQRVLNPL